MLPAPVLGFVNRLLAGQITARSHLARHAGRVLRLRLAGLVFTVRIGSDGAFEAAPADVPVATEIAFGPALLLRLAAGDRKAMAEAEVEGDGVFAADVQRALGSLDLALALEPFLGEVLAARAAQGLEALAAWGEQARLRLARSAAEYLTYENPMLARVDEVRDFVAAVDALRDATARLEARLARLEQGRG